MTIQSPGCESSHKLRGPNPSITFCPNLIVRFVLETCMIFFLLPCILQCMPHPIFSILNFPFHAGKKGHERNKKERYDSITPVSSHKNISRALLFHSRLLYHTCTLCSVFFPVFNKEKLRSKLITF